MHGKLFSSSHSLSLTLSLSPSIVSVSRFVGKETMDSDMRWSTVLERAKEELEILEWQYPNKFDSLKMDLKALISDFEHSQSLLLLPRNSPTSTCSFAASQESSTRRKGSSVPEEDANDEALRVRVSTNDRFIKRKCKTDAVLERAHKCLDKIQRFKTSLYC